MRETIPSTANKGRCTPTSVPFGSPSARGYARGGCVCVLCRPSADVSATRGEATCGRSGGVRGAAMPRLFDSDYHDCVSRCCLGLARRLPAPSGSARCAPPVARPSGDRCAVGGYSATLAYRLGAFPLAFRGGSVRVDSVVRVDRGTSSRLRGSFELDRGTLGGWGELGVAWQRAVSTAGLKRGADGRAAGRRPNDAALMLGVARQAIWAKNNR